MAFPSPYSLYLILLFLLSVSVAAQTSQNITLGSSLTAALNQNSSWKSPSGDFAFGFQQIEAGMFLLAIWFDKIPEKTIIWSAHDENLEPYLVQQGSSIQLTIDGQFRLTDSNGDKEVWVPTLEGSGIVSHAAMLDTGNFVLASQDSINLWQSFNFPTDTLVPTQILKHGSRLVARYTQMNYSSGRFAFVIQDGDLAAYTTKFPLHSLDAYYWTTKTEGNGFQVIFNQSGYIYLEAKNGSILNPIASTGYSSEDNYQRAILEYDGVFRHYVYPKNISFSAESPMAWSILTYVPQDICLSTASPGGMGLGACGFNSYCVMGNNQRPKCLCPPGYSFLDPDNDMNGCKQDFVSQDCKGQDVDLFYLRDMPNTDWPDSDFTSFESVTEDWCRRFCLIDCFCSAAIFRNGKCWKLRYPLLNGYVNVEIEGKTMIKIRKDNSTSTPACKSSGEDSKKKQKSTLNLILTLLLSTSAFFNLVLLITTMWFVSRSRYRKRSMHHLHPSRATQGMMSLQSFTYKELEEATNKFEEELGKGSCSTVYKGVLDIGNKNLVAVKRLHKMEKDQNEKEFQAEMSAIGKTNHKNLVQLLGFCNEGQHRLLVYEYMSNGSLASYLFRNPRPGWYQRIRIAFGIARGLVYLHEECSNQIIHRDIKPENILLDDSLTARISDFGLAKLLKTDQTPTLTEVKGTRGYLAPEWLIGNKPVTAKVDVYSFGILLLEVICCRRKVEQNLEDEKQMILADWAYDCYEEGKLYLLVQEDEEAMEDTKRVERLLMVAVWCIQDDPLLRPTMKRVSQMLEGSLEVPNPPVNSHSSI